MAFHGAGTESNGCYEQVTEASVSSMALWLTQQLKALLTSVPQYLTLAEKEGNTHGQFPSGEYIH